MFVARDPLGMRPLCYAKEGPLFAAASESVALTHLGFSDSSIKNIPPGHAAIIEHGRIFARRSLPTCRGRPTASSSGFISPTSPARSTIAACTSRERGWARSWPSSRQLTIDRDTIIVPVPDTAKAAADAMAYRLNVPSQEGLIRNRYVGRTFIEGQNRADKVRMKYTALPEVLEGKRVLLVEDTIVRSTTMKALISQIKGRGRAKEVHVRIACPPIIAPCFYGIDMSTVSELFAPRFMEGHTLTPEIERKMAAAIGADSLRYLPLEAVAPVPRQAGQQPLPGVHQRRLSDGCRRPAVPDRFEKCPERARADGRPDLRCAAGRVGDSVEGAETPYGGGCRSRASTRFRFASATARPTRWAFCITRIF